MPRPPIDLDTTEGQEFREANINISGRRFIGCQFVDCNLFYDGSGWFWDRCEFNGCSLIPVGSLKDLIAGRSPTKVAKAITDSWKKLQGMVAGAPGVDGFGNIRL